MHTGQKNKWVLHFLRSDGHSGCLSTLWRDLIWPFIWRKCSFEFVLDDFWTINKRQRKLQIDQIRSKLSLSSSCAISDMCSISSQTTKPKRKHTFFYEGFEKNHCTIPRKVTKFKKGGNTKIYFFCTEEFRELAEPGSSGMGDLRGWGRPPRDKWGRNRSFL